jgi:uncharacterized membrane protein
MLVRARALAEQLRASLFLVPMAFVVGGAVLGLITVEIDQELVESPGDLPFVLTSTVDSSRAVLTTIAQATITVAGIAFSVSLLVIQLASSQYSPRVVHGLLRDRLSKTVMGIVVGTFTYCLTVLRAVRSAVEEDGSPVIPNLSVTIALVFGVVSILAIVAFIDHSAHSMDVSRLLRTAADQGLANARRLWGDDAPADPGGPLAEPPDDHLVIRHLDDGWIQHIALDVLAEVAPPGGTVRLETEVGRYAVAGTPLCTIWPSPHDVDAACDRAQEAVVAGASRTAEQDIGYAVRQLADVALRALSPSVNDPTTAQDAMFHAGSVLGELLTRHPPPLVATVDGSRTLLRPERIDRAEVIRLAFDEVRQAATGMPVVAVYLLEILRLLDVRAGHLPDVHDALAAQAALIRAGADQGDLLPADARTIRDAHDRRFGPPA